MTPEELNRTIEFIIQSQARLAAAQEQDRVDRLHAEKERKAFDQRLASLFEIQVRLLESQTRRLDEYEKERQAAQEHRKAFDQQFVQLIETQTRRLDEFHADVQKKHDETIAWLKRIVEKLTDRLN